MAIDDIHLIPHIHKHMSCATVLWSTLPSAQWNPRHWLQIGKAQTKSWRITGDARSVGSKTRTLWMGVCDVRPPQDSRLVLSLIFLPLASLWPAAAKAFSPCALPCRAKHDKRNTTRPEQCVSLFRGLHLMHDMIYIWPLIAIQTCTMAEPLLRTEISLCLSACFAASYAAVIFTLCGCTVFVGFVCVSLCVCALLVLCRRCRRLCSDSGMYAATCDGSYCSWVTPPEEKYYDGQNSHIRKDLMPGCISLHLLCWLLLCPTYCSQPASHPLPLSSSYIHVSRADCVSGLVFAAPVHTLTIDQSIISTIQAATGRRYWSIQVD